MKNYDMTRCAFLRVRACVCFYVSRAFLVLWFLPPYLPPSLPTSFCVGVPVVFMFNAFNAFRCYCCYIQFIFLGLDILFASIVLIEHW